MFSLGLESTPSEFAKENRAFRDCIKVLHRINHDYRDTLSAIFKHGAHRFDQNEYRDYVTQSERKIIKSVCQKIAKIYSSFTHGSCTVTVKLVTRVAEKMFCETYERSEENCDRDTGPSRIFEINTGANTAFDEAIKYATGKVSHFHSEDLTTNGSYRNQRDHWSDFYQSCIVVPIRCVNPDKIGTKDCSDDIGFLCVDTLSDNRLNNTWHVELLAAFADQNAQLRLLDERQIHIADLTYYLPSGNCARTRAGLTLQRGLFIL